MMATEEAVRKSRVGTQAQPIPLLRPPIPARPPSIMRKSPSADMAIGDRYSRESAHSESLPNTSPVLQRPVLENTSSNTTQRITYNRDLEGIDLHYAWRDVINLPQTTGSTTDAAPAASDNYVATVSQPSHESKIYPDIRQMFDVALQPAFQQHPVKMAYPVQIFPPANQQSAQAQAYNAFNTPIYNSGVSVGPQTQQSHMSKNPLKMRYPMQATSPRSGMGKNVSNPMYHTAIGFDNIIQGLMNDSGFIATTNGNSSSITGSNLPPPRPSSAPQFNTSRSLNELAAASSVNIDNSTPVRDGELPVDSIEPMTAISEWAFISSDMPDNNSFAGDLIDLDKSISSFDDSEYLSLDFFDPLSEQYAERAAAENNNIYGENLYSSTEGFSISINDANGINADTVDNTMPRATNDVPITSSDSQSSAAMAGVYEDINDPMQDPFSLAALRERQQKLRNNLDEENPYESVRRAVCGRLVSFGESDRNGRPPLPPRTYETHDRALTRTQGSSSNYECLKPVTFMDEESRSFCDMVNGLKGKYKSVEESCNVGYILSPLVGNIPHNAMTVKVVIQASMMPEPANFTCDIDLLVEHVISQVLYTYMEDSGTLTAADYMLKVHDRAEYLINTYPLSYYEYVYNCLNIDCDIKFDLLKKDQVHCPLLRTTDDDEQPVYFPRDFIQKDPGEVSRNSLDILMETFYKEVEKVRDETLKGETAVIHGHRLAQSVKAVCAILAKIETMSITKALGKIQDIFTQLSNRASQVIDDSSSIYSDPQIFQTFDTSHKCSLLEKLQDGLDELSIAIQSLVNLYCRIFQMDFTLQTEKPQYTESQDVTTALDHFLFHVASAHRITGPIASLYEDFCVVCNLCYNGRILGEAVETGPMPLTRTGLCERIVWDEWLQIRELCLCTLPRESRLCLTLYGRKSVQNAASGSTQETTLVKIPLGGATIQLFDHKGNLVQGDQLVIFSPGGHADPVDPPLVSLLPDSILLQVNLPDFGKQIFFPEVIPQSLSIKHFHTLPEDVQEMLMELLLKDIITEYAEEEREEILDKRLYLCENSLFLPKLLQCWHSWDWACLSEVHSLLHAWVEPEPYEALQLLLPRFSDIHVRNYAVQCLKKMPPDDLVNFLPQLVQALKFESYHSSALAEMLLEMACRNIRFAHNLFWSLKEGAQDLKHRRRFHLMFGALMSITGDALRKALRKQEELTRILGTTAEKVKAAKDKEVCLKRELQVLYELFDQKGNILLPLNPSMEASGMDFKSCSYFLSNAVPLKLVFNNANIKADPFYTIFKVGDDLRQDMLVLQLIHIMDCLWKKHGLDLKMITFNVLTTGPKRGMIELVTESETLRKIQVSYGVTGSFKDRPIKDWLQKHNITELDYQKAVDNFLRSCAGYCVATYILGICDRHNDNIMIKQSGHMFHIDFGKFLGDAQMFGNFKRDRVPFVLTSDMAYVINDGDRPSSRFQYFVDLCCQSFNVLRSNANLFITLFSLMSRSGIPGVTSRAATYVQKALLPDSSNAEATAFFTKMIDESLKSVFAQFNFFIHTLAQMKFSSHNEGLLLSFVPKVYSVHTDGRIDQVHIVESQKRYAPEKHYVYLIKIIRENQRMPSLIFRKFSEFVEFRDKLVATFPKTALPDISNKDYVAPRSFLGRQNRAVAESRKHELDHFLKELFDKAPEISHCDLVYTFFHPLLRDEQDDEGLGTVRLKESMLLPMDNNAVIKGQVKVSIQYRKGALAVMIMHAKDLKCENEYPSPYVKTYLLPDPFKQTKQKTKVAKMTTNPVYNEIMSYKVSRDDVTCRILQVTVWNHESLKVNGFLGAVYIRLRDLNLSTETIKWHNLGYLQAISDML